MTHSNPSRPLPPRIALEITVADHPGVMVHVSSLFSRRAYNMDGILCLPLPEGGESRMWILVDPDARLDQLEQQLLKLHDVRAVQRREVDPDVLTRLAGLLSG